MGQRERQRFEAAITRASRAGRGDALRIAAEALQTDNEAFALADLPAPRRSAQRR